MLSHGQGISQIKIEPAKNQKFSQVDVVALDNTPLTRREEHKDLAADGVTDGFPLEMKLVPSAGYALGPHNFPVSSLPHMSFPWIKSGTMLGAPGLHGIAAALWNAGKSDAKIMSFEEGLSRLKKMLDEFSRLYVAKPLCLLPL